MAITFSGPIYCHRDGQNPALVSIPLTSPTTFDEMKAQSIAYVQSLLAVPQQQVIDYNEVLEAIEGTPPPSP